jgi:hypothetical protein
MVSDINRINGCRKIISRFNCVGRYLNYDTKVLKKNEFIN